MVLALLTPKVASSVAAKIAAQGSPNQRSEVRKRFSLDKGDQSEDLKIRQRRCLESSSLRDFSIVKEVR